MLNSTQQTLAVAHQAWRAWNETDIAQRASLLKAWASTFSFEQDNAPQLDALASKMVNFQIKNALTLLSQSLIMPGPTGEINELTTAGRGVFVIASQQEVPIVAVVGLLTNALITGNTVLLSLSAEQHSLAEQLCTELHQQGIGKQVVTYIDNSELLSLIKAPSVAGVGFIGSNTQAIAINQRLATRKGQLVSLIAETDLQELPRLNDQQLAFHFITEKTKTVNVTAVGGNATLLALGCGDQ